MAKAARTLRLPAGARRLRCTAGSSDKFYDIILEGSTYTVNYGRWGSSGAFMSKEFRTVTEARQAYDRVIRSKLQKGYRDVTDEQGRQSEGRRLNTQGTNLQDAMDQATPRQTSAPRTAASKKTPESVGRRRRKLLD